MDPYEKLTLIDRLKEKTVCSGDQIIKQGEEGNEFFIVEDGTAKTEKDVDGEVKEGKQYGTGGYFGEIALLNNVPRQASVIATSDARLMVLDKDGFVGLLAQPGVEQKLRAGLEAYEKC